MSFSFPHVSSPLSSDFTLPISPLFPSILSLLDGCVGARRPLGEFGGVAPAVSCHFSNQQQPKQHGTRSVSGPKSREWRHTARSAARTAHYSHGKRRGWWDGGEGVPMRFALYCLYFTFWILDINTSLLWKLWILKKGFIPQMCPSKAPALKMDQ